MSSARKRVRIEPGGNVDNGADEPREALVIGFHYHIARTSTLRLGIRRGDQLCHVFSDLPDLEDAARELRAWSHIFGLTDIRIQERGSIRQHMDLWGPWLQICGPAADRATSRRWLRR